MVPLVACGGGGGDSGTSGESTDGADQSVVTSPDTNVTVFAAASLTDALGEIGERMTEANPAFDFTYNFAGSQQLVTQLIEGADADVFASANVSQMTAAREGGVINGDPVVFTRNRLAIVVPLDNPGGITQPADLANDDLKIVVANEAVPVGTYTLEMLDLMSADPAFGPDFRANVDDNFVSEEDNVKQVVAKVQLGEADAGIVYVTDITNDVAEDVTLIEVPAQFNVIAEYPIVPVAGGNTELAQAFIAFLLSDAGQAILADHGFTARS